MIQAAKRNLIFSSTIVHPRQFVQYLTALIHKVNTFLLSERPITIWLCKSSVVTYRFLLFLCLLVLICVSSFKGSSGVKKRQSRIWGGIFSDSIPLYSPIPCHHIFFPYLHVDDESQKSQTYFALNTQFLSTPNVALGSFWRSYKNCPQPQTFNHPPLLQKAFFRVADVKS